MIKLDREACYRALQTRDTRFDGRFYICVLSTRIYCRPICPTRPPKLGNCVFVPSAAAAHAAGFRPCLRCRPEIAPGLAGWRGTVNTVSRALALIAEGAVDEGSVEALAERVGVGARHLRRLFDEHVGASPIAVAQTQRLHFAKRLISETSLPMAEVALAAGFGSIRRFNAVLRGTYGRPPREIRRTRRADAPRTDAGITLRLPFTAPYDWAAMIAFLAARAIPGVERVEQARYARTIALDGSIGSVEVVPIPGAMHLLATIRISRVAILAAVVGRLRRLFDLEADTPAIERHLAQDARLTPLVAARPGLRVPGTWDAFELAVRAVLGQQVSVAAAATFAGRLATAYGEPFADASPGGSGLTHLFPRAEALVGADLTTIGLTRSRAATISGLAAAVVANPRLLDPYGTLEDAVSRLTSLPGIGPWTAQYIAMRALGEPDAFPAGDLGLRRAWSTNGVPPTPRALVASAEAWRPWRAYATLHLWMASAAGMLPDRTLERIVKKRTEERDASAAAQL